VHDEFSAHLTYNDHTTLITHYEMYKVQSSFWVTSTLSSQTISPATCLETPVCCYLSKRDPNFTPTYNGYN